jgi:tetratricopeptide (TPR) repeat protein
LEEDPPEVKAILRTYGDQNDAERKNRMERLAQLPAAAGIPALCRLGRFESSAWLSKQAALLLISSPAPQDKAAREAMAASIERQLGLSKRDGAQWMRAYAKTLRDPEQSLPMWEELTQAELEALAQSPEDERNRKLVLDFLFEHAELLLRLEHHDEAMSVMRRSVELLDGKQRTQLVEAVDWMMKNRAWPVVDDVAKRFSELFDRDPVLMYRLAECRQHQGRIEESETIAQRAIEIQGDEPELHIVTAFSLQSRGMFKWAQREYQFVMNVEKPGTISELRARFLLSEMLHDVGDDSTAAEVLRKTVEVMDEDNNVVQLLDRMGRSPGSVRSRMLYFAAEQAIHTGDAIKQREHLAKAIASDPLDADVLIAMHRLEGADAEWKELTQNRIDAAVGKFRTEVQEYKLIAETAQSEIERATANRQLATSCNQLAWLVGNTSTKRDELDEAVQASHLSLELRPDAAGYFDTLGRCYFSRGDLDKAVHYQRKAVELEPFSGQINRQLELFEKALSAKQGGK